MEFRTKVDIRPAAWKIEPCERMLFAGSCFAANIGARFRQEMFRAAVNPFGVMYNPVSVLHTIEKIIANPPAIWGGKQPAVTVISLGTNRVYIDRATGLVADNCQKRPAADFIEKDLSIDECYAALEKALQLLGGRLILTVSPIRYKKYGFHASRLAKAVLLLAAEKLARACPRQAEYFPSYEIIADELRDYRFYEPDMLHPSRQAVDYIFTRFAEAYFSEKTAAFLSEWKPLKEALAHRPFAPDSPEYAAFLTKTKLSVEALRKKYPDMPETDITH
ncbi:MAG: GSCFA domain-containing protein [Prevotella sp.]|nr:GSCFA domain-containing protein [Prevotella sp.]